MILSGNYMKKIKIKFLILFVSLSTFGFAQQDLTIHLMPMVPQSIYTNPSLMPTPKVYVSFPALSSIYFGLSHNGFAYKDIIRERPSDDSLYIDVDNALGKMAKKNYISTNFQLELFSFGFKVKKKNYFSVSISEKVAVKVGYPKDLFGLLWKGNGQYIGKTADFSGLGANITHYAEVGFGYTRVINDKLTVGIRPKYLLGMMNLYTKKSELTLKTAEEDYALTAKSNLIVNSSLDSNIYSKDGNGFDPIGYFLNTNNKGYAIDLGATYKLTQRISFSASVIDLGRIKWTTTPRNFVSPEAEYTFSGIDLNDFLSKADSNSSGIDKMTDSLKNTFKLTETNESYTSPVGTKIYLTGVFNLTPKDRVGALVRFEVFNGQLHPSYTLSYNKQIGSVLSLTANYSILNRSYSNVGFGMAVNLGFWQIYLTSDNVWGAFYPTTARNAIIHFGMNFVFGYRKMKDNANIPQMRF